MSIIQGVVISFTPQMKATKQGGGTFDAWELAYRNPANEIKAITKPVQQLRFNPAVASALNSLKPGDEFTLYQEKNEKGYLDVKSIEKGIKSTQEVALGPTPDGNRSEVRGGKVTGSNYETPEERAKKQVVIVRQGVLNAAIEYSKMFEVKPNQEEIVELAQKFEKYVYKDLTKTAKKYIEVTLKEEVPAE